MQLKTIVRVHGKITSDRSIGEQTIVVENNADEQIMAMFDNGWGLLDMGMEVEDGVLFDVWYFAKEDGENDHVLDLDYGNDLDDDISKFLGRD